MIFLFEEGFCFLVFPGLDQLMVSKEANAERREQSATQAALGDQAALPCIKEEQDELFTKKEEEELCCSAQEAEVARFPFTPARNDEEEEQPETSQLQQPEHREPTRQPAGADAEEGGAPAAAPSSQPAGCLVWELQSRDEPVSDEDYGLGQAAYGSSECPPGSEQVYSGAQPVAKPFGCSVCGHSFNQSKYLKNHMRLHADGRSLSCSVCQKSFLWKTVLDAHMRIHTGEKPYSCSLCGARFTHGSNLASHRKTHSGVKPHTCSVCKASFSRRHHLSRHMKIHTGEKPFACYFCGKRFRERAYLSRHLNGHAAGGL